MAFGLIQWFMSIAIFFFVLGVITWTAVHLGQKEVDFISTRFLDNNIYPTRKENKPVNSMPPIADHQGFEVQNSAQFYNIIRAISSAQERAINNTGNNNVNSDITTRTLVSSVASNNSARHEGIKDAAYTSDEFVTLNNHWNVSEDLSKSSTRVPETAALSTVPREYFNTERSQTSSSYSPEFSDFFNDKRNGTSSAAAAFSFTRVSPNAKRQATMKRTETTESTRYRVVQDERLKTETSTIPRYFYVTAYTTGDP